jgi:hypothetical protein
MHGGDAQKGIGASFLVGELARALVGEDRPVTFDLPPEKLDLLMTLLGPPVELEVLPKPDGDNADDATLIVALSCGVAAACLEARFRLGDVDRAPLARPASAVGDS